MKRFLTWIIRISTLKSVLLVLIVFMVFILVVLPSESAKSEAMSLIESIDTSLYYSSSDLYRIAESYGEAGRSFYITQRFTFDLVWPFVYAGFLLITTSYLALKVGLKRYLRIFLVLILAGVGLDFLENICASIVLFRYPEKTPLIADLSGFATSLKWLSLGGSFIILLGLLLLFIGRFFARLLNKIGLR